MPQTVLTERRGEVGIVRLNRPLVLNAINEDLRDDFIAAMRAQNVDEAVRAVVVTGAGRAFSVGLDMDVSVRLDQHNVASWLRGIQRFFQAIRDMDKPTVAAVNGYATGLGFQTALHCDIRVGHAGLKVGQPEINAGVPSVLGHMILSALMGLSRTIEISLSCRLLEAEEALRYNLLHELAPAEGLLERALVIAADLAARPPVAMRLTKRRMRDVTQSAFDQAIAAATDLQVQAYASGEPQRLARAFLARQAARRKE